MTVMHAPLQNLSERAEFYLTLGRAFLPPTSPEFREVLVDGLADDLEELNAVLGLPIADDLAAFRAACAKSDGTSHDKGVLLAYSRLFLSPPILVTLNGGFHLDGAMMGDTTLRMESWYARHAMQRSPVFHDLPDHLGLVLEFLAFLIDRAATLDAETAQGEGSSQREDALEEAVGWAREMLLPWVPTLPHKIAEAEQEEDIILPPHPYGALAQVLAKALVADFQAIAEAPADEMVEDASLSQPEGEPALCIKCGAYICEASELIEVERLLTEKGLPTAHLRVCSDCRDGSQGYTHQPIPGADRVTQRRTLFQGKG